MRVCSSHFVDGEPTYTNPYPIRKMGYDAEAKLKRLNAESSRKKLLFKSPIPNKRPKIKESLKNDQNRLTVHQNQSSDNLLNNNSTNQQSNVNNISSKFFLNVPVVKNPNISTKLSTNQPLAHVFSENNINFTISQNESSKIYQPTLTSSNIEEETSLNNFSNNFLQQNSSNVSLFSPTSNRESVLSANNLNVPVFQQKNNQTASINSSTIENEISLHKFINTINKPMQQNTSNLSFFSTSSHERTALASDLENFNLTSTPSCGKYAKVELFQTNELEKKNHKLQQELNFLKQQNHILSTSLKKTFSTIKFLKNKIKSKSNNLLKFKQEHNDCNQPLHEKLLKSDKLCNFYTGIKSLKEFEALHDSIAPFVRRRWRGVKKTSAAIVRKYKNKPKCFGPKRKLSSKDEFLMMLMKLKLALLTGDLADRFKISIGLTSEIITSWIKATSSILGCMVYIPDYENIRNTTPARFVRMGYADTHSILDGTEFFIETPKNLDLQKSTWSDYKHHNTLKSLICVAPNSTIMFASKAYGGSISDKEITVRSQYLDKIPMHSRIMFDKGFNINEECAQRMIKFTVPPGRRGAAQMTPAEIKKTKEIANLRILVEQVIRRIKTFRILAVEFPITMLRVFDDVLTICAALSNLRKPIYLT